VNKNDVESQDGVLEKAFCGIATRLISKQRKITKFQLKSGGGSPSLGELESGVKFQPYFSLCEPEI
jgi:hypothetical protein